MSRPSTIRLAPSILAADFARLGEQIAAAEAAGADAIHVDIMDGIFVPNISIGLPVVAAARRATQLPLDIHLMIDRPERYLAEFVEAGASALTVHVEGALHLYRTLTQIRELGAQAGVVLNPATPPGALAEVLPLVDIVLVMTVNPGFGGQAFIESQLAKIAALRALLDGGGYGAALSADGGIGPQNVARVVAAGADTIVAGSAVFNDRETVAAAIAALRAGMAEAVAQRENAP
ncbi:MAG TPA: ribulose-phosphate 3-epimerase [Thermomicrobiales bacterium]|nr:ribulose-phosphate 3-epimerase [Thermomicrobiales bacterium]